ncbi:MAG: hypothetical protein ACI4B5_01355 [Bacteroidaceae bacterium]
MTQPPHIHHSTREERTNYVKKQWECLGHCPSCGKCHLLKGKDATELYQDYINGIRPYLDITLEIRRR